ncbi:actin filament-associated protein 1-like 2, partial [Poecilia reticulata]|uniref:actin filament-associated protein 1-like 2 n=1 Tax=Poecilia reticulata TaxID=8081 RepID=UPI0007E9AC96
MCVGFTQTGVGSAPSLNLTFYWSPLNKHETDFHCRWIETINGCQKKTSEESLPLLDQLLMELHRFLLLLDRETLSGNATVQKGLLSDLLLSYRTPSGGDEEYIYMNKVAVSGKGKDNKGKR